MSGHTTRLDTNVKLCPEAQQLQAKAQLYTKERRGYIQERADHYRIALVPLEMDNIYNIVDSTSQGILKTFKEVADRELADFVKKNPDRVRPSLLSDWMNEDMNDQEKARREIAGWYDNLKIAFFDTETTGFYDEGHVPVTAAACGRDDVKLCDIQMAPLNEKGEPISITEGASKANHLTDAILAGYQPLEESEWALRELEILMEGGYILTGYNTQFDRQMICRAIVYADDRLCKDGDDPTKETLATANRLRALHTYFADPSHWLETKDIFCRAVGEQPYPGPGKYLKLEDIARRTNVLATGENQEHGALADCQLIARIVRKIREEFTDMPKPKTAAKGPFPPAANPAENETETDPKSELKEYVETLEQNLETAQTEYNQLEEKFNAVNEERVKLGNRVRELENLCEEYQQADGIKHHEARDLTWCDLEINGFQLNFTRREGETVEQSINAILDHIRVMQALKAHEKVATLRVGLKGDWKPLKGFEKGNGKPADENYQPPANDRPATPKGAQPAAANKPNVPPKPGNAPAPQQQQPSNPPQGKTTGEKKSQQCDRIIRHQIDGQNTYDLPFTLSNGKPADRPFAPSKKDTAALEKALLAAGYTLDVFEIGTEYDLPILVEWTVGNQIPNSNPPKFYRDNMTFTIQAATTEEMPF